MDSDFVTKTVFIAEYKGHFLGTFRSEEKAQEFLDDLKKRIDRSKTND